MFYGVFSFNLLRPKTVKKVLFTPLFFSIFGLFLRDDNWIFSIE